MLKTMLKRICDICDKEEGKFRSLYKGMGFQATNSDPLAQHFKRTFDKLDVCDKCYKDAKEAILRWLSYDIETLLISTELKSMRDYNLAYECTNIKEEEEGERHE